MKVNLFDFAKESPGKYPHQVLEQYKRLYLPPDLVPPEKKQIQKVARTFACQPISPLFSTMICALMRDIR